MNIFHQYVLHFLPQPRETHLKLPKATTIQLHVLLCHMQLIMVPPYFLFFFPIFKWYCSEHTEDIAQFCYSFLHVYLNNCILKLVLKAV